VSVEPLERLTEQVTGQLGGIATDCGAARLGAIMRLVIRHWPHEHLRVLARAGGRNHADLVHVGRLLRCQVREQWEARHGAGPLWDSLLGGTTSAIGVVILDLWWPSRPWRAILRAMGRAVADLPHDPQGGVRQV